MNPWYAFTYEAILDLANWDELEADVAKKVVGIYSWMPQTIMKLRMPQNRFMCDVHTLESVTNAARQAAEGIGPFNDIALEDLDIDNRAGEVQDVIAPLFNVLGSVAASKYLHFSRPNFFPMWDATLRNEVGFQNTPEGFIQYMSLFKRELAVPENIEAAAQRYPHNLIRGWDIVKMENRNA